MKFIRVNVSQRMNFFVYLGIERITKSEEIKIDTIEVVKVERERLIGLVLFGFRDF